MDAAVAELVGLLPEGVVVDRPGRRREVPLRLDPRRRRRHPARRRPRRERRAGAGDVRWASAHGIPVVPRGAGPGLSGGSLAVDGGIVLSTERMRAIEIDTASRVAVVEPGALNVEVKQAAAEEGLWYPPDPSSYEICSIGGNVATNAGGLCCVKYGVTTDYVLGLDVVLADGTLRHPRRQADQGRRRACRCSSSSSAARAPSASSPGRSCGSSRPGAPLDARRHLPHGRRGRRRRRRARPHPAGLDDGADGPRLDQRGRGLPPDGPGPRRRCPAGHPVRRPRRRPRRRGRRGARRPARRPAPRRCSSPTTPRRARCSCRPGGCTSRAIETRGAVLLEDVGVPIPLLPDLLAAVEAIAGGTTSRSPSSPTPATATPTR